MKAAKAGAAAKNTVTESTGAAQDTLSSIYKQIKEEVAKDLAKGSGK